MKTILFILVAFIIFSCSTSKRDEVSSGDSTLIANDTSHVAVASSEMPQEELMISD